MIKRKPAVPIEEVGEDLGRGGWRWAGGVISRDGCIYCIPYNATRVLKFDPSNGSSCLIGDELGEDKGKWCCGVLGDGYIYGIPFNSHRVLKIDLTNNNTSFVGCELGSGALKWMSGAIANDGCMYCMPLGARHILQLDVVTEKISFVGIDLGEGIWKYSGTVLGNDGCIYGVPANARQVLKYNPIDRTCTYIGCTTASICCDDGKRGEKWRGGVRALDGNIYGVPYNSDHILCINVNEQSISLVGDCQLGNRKWDGGTVAEDGCIYFTPYSSTEVLKFDPIDQSATLLKTKLSGAHAKWSGNTLGHDGSIYCIPLNAQLILRINVAATIDKIHDILKLKLWYNARRMLGDSTLSQTIKSQAVAKMDDVGNNVLYTALKNNAPVGLIKIIVESNYLLIGVSDAMSGLYPFMTAAANPDSSMSVVYEVLRYHPGLMHEFF